MVRVELECGQWEGMELETGISGEDDIRQEIQGIANEVGKRDKQTQKRETNWAYYYIQSPDKIKLIKSHYRRA